MKASFTAIAIVALLGAGHAAAQTTTATASQQSAATSTAQGSIEFSQSPEHTSQTVRNVSAPVLGAYASSFSQFNCGQTTQGGFAVAGFSGAFGSSKDQRSCVLEVAAAEMTRQSTVDAEHAAALRAAAIGIRCQISEEIYQAMRDAGFECKRKPKALTAREQTQPESTRIAGN
ncbi:hypothetical protein P9239_00185 [Caballeronia sp. LZ062]|uniref:hypothetical protein n=1 Tax=unclassified Caballeronia TaxID=2646786 RepID=UPI0028567BC3|nr:MULTISPECIES: hypothetical protein [unclassified Caballeronia]MDR5856640.1 hypothetical protein [Caballeronia sp. LZ050]MDR5868774.1 hypothetical protein [Caballeronia sp. LZ062]